jgi:uncharacterized coiled-coil protein SlyX
MKKRIEERLDGLEKHTHRTPAVEELKEALRELRKRVEALEVTVTELGSVATTDPADAPHAGESR